MTGCSAMPHAGQAESRRGDEIVAAGQFFHAGSPVVTWMDPRRVCDSLPRGTARFAPLDKSDWATTSAEVKGMRTPNRYGMRAASLTPEQIEKVRGGGWDLPLLQNVVDQLVMHFDVCGTSRTCFNVLQDDRDLSVHFMVDLDGTIYQTLDLKERAWHATTSNDRSVGIEIAKISVLYPATRNQRARPMVSDQRERRDDDYVACEVWRWRRAHEEFRRSSSTTAADTRRDSRGRSGAVRFYSRAIRRVDEADRSALQSFPEIAMPLPD